MGRDLPLHLHPRRLVKVRISVCNHTTKRVPRVLKPHASFLGFIIWHRHDDLTTRCVHDFAAGDSQSTLQCLQPAFWGAQQGVHRALIFDAETHDSPDRGALGGCSTQQLAGPRRRLLTSGWPRWSYGERPTATNSRGCTNSDPSWMQKTAGFTFSAYSESLSTSGRWSAEQS